MAVQIDEHFVHEQRLKALVIIAFAIGILAAFVLLVYLCKAITNRLSRGRRSSRHIWDQTSSTSRPFTIVRVIPDEEDCPPSYYPPAYEDDNSGESHGLLNGSQKAQSQ